MDDAASFRSRDLMSAIHPGAFHWDVTTNLVTGEANLARMFALDDAEVRRGVGLEQFIERIHLSDRAMIYTSLATALKRRGFYWAQYRILRPSGELHVQGFGRCDEINGRRVMSGAVFDLTGFLPSGCESQEEADLEQIAHNCVLSRALALRNGYTEVTKLLQFALEDVDQRVPGRADDAHA